MLPLKITFHTDGTGLVWDIHKPHHLDAILSYSIRVLNNKSMDCDPEQPQVASRIEVIKCFLD
jgi:hypothetical protein